MPALWLRLSNLRPEPPGQPGDADCRDTAQEYGEPLPDRLSGNRQEGPSRQTPDLRRQHVRHGIAGGRSPGLDHVGRPALHGTVLDQVVEPVRPRYAVPGEQELAGPLAVRHLGDRDLGARYRPACQVLSRHRRRIGDRIEWRQIDPTERFVKIKSIGNPDAKQQRFADVGQVERAQGPSYLRVGLSGALARQPGAIRHLRIVTKRQKRRTRTGCVDGLQRISMGFRGDAGCRRAQEHDQPRKH